MGDHINFGTYPRHAANEAEMDRISDHAFGQISEYVPIAELMGQALVREEFVNPNGDQIRADRLAELDALDALSEAAFTRLGWMRSHWAAEAAEPQGQIVARQVKVAL